MNLQPDRERGGSSAITRSTWRTWVADHWVHLAGAAFLTFVGIVFGTVGDESEWHHCFVPAARHMAACEPIHHSGVESYTYPPAMAMLAVPFSLGSITGSLLAWYAVNVVACLVWFLCTWRLVGGKELTRISGPWLAVLGAGVLVSARWILTPFMHQQFDVVIAALLMAGCYQLWRGKDLSAGALIGASAAMKCTPLLFLPYLVWRKKPAAAGMLFLAAVGLNVLPDLFFPQAEGGSYLADWVNVYLRPMSKSAPGDWHSFLLLNQSVGGLIQRFARYGFVFSAENLDEIQLSAETIPGLWYLTLGTCAALVAASFLGFGRLWQAPRVVDQSQSIEPHDLQVGWEAAALVCLMLLLSPMSSKAHYIVVFLPCLLIARAAFVDRRQTTPPRAFLILLLVTGTLTTKGIVGRSLGDLLLVWGMPTWYVAIAWVGSLRGARACHAGLNSPATILRTPLPTNSTPRERKVA